ncbi:hypothetical protein ASPSYDRAFT_88183 [Aspergillus sydowii CBS 593.65]|uniref:AB hydrolase-1 domain-containing protein n=1 Tax=Aspergillus sydowii CBS 593.65 TaxID=1036612 RepID=A0A1L9TQE1_9EURO|nr:uncharacterized protein ASPSYDRAFT_88183 [Aspergillus sydowii CBS 593.65]OJJ61647.1 hypothetical protein ASPSYDRAFT_88183 [Aspergillus sydowii CBS 593.65]
MTDPLKTLEAEPRYRETNISRKNFPVAGIQTAVFGLDELPPQASGIACLWLLHPRLATQERMVPIATAVIKDWNKRIQDGQTGSGKPVKGLIAVAFDQRNHGTRLVDPLCNEAWRQGNPRHAQDMFSVFQGTARDTSLLIDYLPAFVFPKSDRQITENLVLGVSLGGHAAWSCILHEPRITAGVVIIGCPDYANVMADRARLSKLPSYTSTTPPGAQFLESEDFPTTLLETVRKWDPAGLLLSHLNLGPEAEPIRGAPIPEPTEAQKTALRPLLTRCLAGKKILNLSGGVDKLVPYSKGETFLTWLKLAVGPNGWFADGAVTLEDIIDQNAGHEVTSKMVDEAVRFIGDVIASGKDKLEASVRSSKI